MYKTENVSTIISEIDDKFFAFSKTSIPSSHYALSFKNCWMAVNKHSFVKNDTKMEYMLL